MNNKKSQGLSLNTIIIAAIVLVVLVVLWAIFTGRMGMFTGGVNLQDLEAKAAAENIGKDTCAGTCFARVGQDSSGKWKIFKVHGSEHGDTKCMANQVKLWDIGEGACCVEKSPTQSDSGC